MPKRKGHTPPWLTPDGEFDPTAWPLSDMVEKALSEEEQKFRTGCSLLSSRAGLGAKDAEVALLGLMAWYADDLERLAEVVRYLRGSDSEATVNVLVAELRRVPSSNTTRRYLKTVIDALTWLPEKLVNHRFAELAEDRSFSYRMRAKFRELASGFRPL